MCVLYKIRNQILISGIKATVQENSSRGEAE